MIPYSRQTVTRRDIRAVARVLRGSYLTQGPTVEKFERGVAEFVGAKFAVSFSSATAALHASAWATGLGPGDLVYTSPLTFMASANCARYVGATPGLIDIDENTLNMDLSRLPLDTKAVVPVHFAGLPVELEKYFSDDRPKVVIEDAAHALGAETPTGRVGDCRFADVTCFSFHPVKPITAGEGGIATTNNSEIAERLIRFRTHGIVRRPEKGGWVYQIDDLGYNYRLTDIQAALGLSQLSRLEKYVDRRNEIATLYRQYLGGLPLILPPEAPEGYLHAYHLFVIRHPARDLLYERLREVGIAAQVHYVPVHHHPISRDLGANQVGFPVADKVYNEILSIPMFPSLTDKEVSLVARKIEEVVGVN